MALKRVNVILEKDTIKRLKKIITDLQIVYSVSPSDLIRFALFEIYGIPFNSCHTSSFRLKEEIDLFKTQKEKFSTTFKAKERRNLK